MRSLSNRLKEKSPAKPWGRIPLNCRGETAVEHKTPPFSPKEVTLFLLCVAIIALAVCVIALMIWRSPGHEQIQTQPTGASVLSLTPQANA
jgi:hypothetical protein